MVLSWIDLSISNFAKPFSLSLASKDFLFLAGETHTGKLLRALAGFLPNESNSADAIRLDEQRLKSHERLNSVLLPKNFAQSLPPHRTIGQFALDISQNRNKKSLETYALKYGIERHVLHSKPSKVHKQMLQKVSLWCTSLFTSAAIFIEEPDGGFCPECQPFDFLQGLLANSITNCIIYSASAKDVILQKARALQLCRARIAIFCADRLVEEGEALRVLREPVHNYTKDWIDHGSFTPLKNNSLWNYCNHNCEEQHNCQTRRAIHSVMWDCSGEGLHRVICKGFL